MGQGSSRKGPAAGLLSPQMFTDCFKRRGDATHWETWTCPHFFFSRLALLSMAKKYVSLSTSDVVNKFFEAL